jgi:hypothetical protein
VSRHAVPLLAKRHWQGRRPAVAAAAVARIVRDRRAPVVVLSAVLSVVRAPEKDGLVWEGVTAEGQGITSGFIGVCDLRCAKKKKKDLPPPAR